MPRRFIGTCAGEPEIAETLDLLEDDVLVVMLAHNLELCPECEYWVEAGELVDEDGELKVCDACL